MLKLRILQADDRFRQYILAHGFDTDGSYLK